METEDRVNSPSHYKADGQPECIVVLEVLVRRFKKIAALCFGQFKYLYRAGLKNEEGMTIDTKSREDVNKLIWYVKHIRKIMFDEAKNLMKPNSTKIPKAVFNKYIDDTNQPNIGIENRVIEAFQYNKKPSILSSIEKAIRLVFNFTTFDELDSLIKELEYIANNI